MAVDYKTQPTYKGTNLAREIAEGRAKVGATPSLSVPGIDMIGVGTGTALTVNQVRYFPTVVVTAITLDQLVVEVATAGAAGKLVRLGIYNADSDWQPTSLVLDAGTVAVDSTGVKTISISQVLAPGRYLLALNSDGTPTLRLIRGGTRSIGINPILGTSPFRNTFSASQTFGTLPSTGTAVTAYTTSTNLPFDYYMFCRVSVP